MARPRESHISSSFALLAVIAIVLLTTTIVVAAIVTGDSKTNISNDVTITQLQLDAPDDAVAGDLMIANVAVNGGSSISIAPPPGWTLIERTDNGGNVGIATYWKIAGASEAISTWTLTPRTRAAGGITRYTGIDTDDPIVAAEGAFGGGTIATAPSANASVANTKVVALFAVNSGLGNSTISTPTGMTERYEVKNSPFGPTTALSDMDFAGTGATGGKNATVSTRLPRNWAAQQIVLRPLLVDLSSIDLERDSDQYLFIDDVAAPALDITGDITVEAWVKFESLPQTEGGNSAYAIASKYNEPPDGDHAWNFGVQVIGGELFIGFEHRDDNGDFNNHSRYKLQYDFEAGVWYHVAVVVDAANAMGTFYINGTQYSPAPISQNATSILNAAAPFRIGALGVEGQPVQFFDGVIDEVRIWNVQRTETEINEGMSNELTSSEPGLVGYWKLNDSLDSTPAGYTLNNPNNAQFSTDKPF